jgi:ribosomal subunit interface protein
MELIVRNRNGKLSERQREHIETKLSKLSRYLDSISQAEVEVSTEQRQQEGETHRMQVTLLGEHGVRLRAEQSAPDLYVATDMVQEVLQRQIKRFKEKHWRRGRLRRKGNEFIMPEALPEPVAVDTGEESEQERGFLRVKEFKLTPMYSDEAVEQMELLDHSFFVFRDADTERVSIVYRRKDGNYGLIVPE